MLIRAVAIALLLSLAVSCGGLKTKSTAQAEFDTGLSLFNRGLFEEALPHFERATELEPDFGEAYLYIGRSYLNLGMWAEALYPLRTAFRLAPEDSKREIAEIILDVLIKNATQVDPDTDMQLKEILK